MWPFRKKQVRLTVATGPINPIARAVALTPPADIERFPQPPCKYCNQKATHKVVYGQGATYSFLSDYLWCEAHAKEQVDREVRIEERLPEWKKRWAAEDAWRKASR